MTYNKKNGNVWLAALLAFVIALSSPWEASAAYYYAGGASATGGTDSVAIGTGTSATEQFSVAIGPGAHVVDINNIDFGGSV
ncbi:MAG: hypothetical protein Q4F74_07415, partial [Synergistaceae bacterium]|nr:hypothetical protein [Synergistaceae bacterium]